MLIKALEALTIRDASTGKLTSIAHGTVAEVDSTVGNELITEGLAEEYSSGGGGSSDFSTAELIFSKSGGVAGNLIVPWVVDDGEYNSALGDVVESGTYNIILYRGNAYATFIQYGTGPFNIAGTGDIEIDGTDMYITGDCTITIS